jgi:clan AA aspartic protease (TIGR02281 family)
MKILLLTSAALLLTSPAFAGDRMMNNPLTPSEYEARVLTLDEKYAALRQQKENEYAALREQKEKELADLKARITSAKEELTRAREELAEALNRNNSRKIQAGLPAEIDSAPQKVRLLMEPGTVRVWPAPRPFVSAIVGSKVLDAKPSDAGNADLVISAQEEEGYGNIILTDEQGKVIADIQVQVGHPMRREDKMKGSDHVQHVKISDDGHFYPKVTINGTAVRLVADTGATFVALSAEDARKAGVDLQSLPVNGKAQTANGVVQDKQFVLPEITVEGFVLRNVPASCCVTGTSLLGMSALGQLGLQMKDGWMFLSPKS